ncbi:hypothetical protein RFI_26951, partial [Reticulomyxa filosa]
HTHTHTQTTKSFLLLLCAVYFVNSDEVVLQNIHHQLMTEDLIVNAQAMQANPRTQEHERELEIDLELHPELENTTMLDENTISPISEDDLLRSKLSAFPILRPTVPVWTQSDCTLSSKQTTTQTSTAVGTNSNFISSSQSSHKGLPNVCARKTREIETYITHIDTLFFFAIHIECDAKPKTKLGVNIGAHEGSEVTKEYLAESQTNVTRGSSDTDQNPNNSNHKDNRSNNDDRLPRMDEKTDEPQVMDKPFSQMNATTIANQLQKKNNDITTLTAETNPKFSFQPKRDSDVSVPAMHIEDEYNKSNWSLSLPDLPTDRKSWVDQGNIVEKENFLNVVHRQSTDHSQSETQTSDVATYLQKNNVDHVNIASARPPSQIPPTKNIGGDTPRLESGSKLESEKKASVDYLGSDTSSEHVHKRPTNVLNAEGFEKLDSRSTSTFSKSQSRVSTLFEALYLFLVVSVFCLWLVKKQLRDEK